MLKKRVDTVSSPYVAENACAYSSPDSLTAAYGDRGRPGTSSDWPVALDSPPYALLLAAYTTRRTPLRRAASRTCTVAVAQARWLTSGVSTLRWTEASAPTW